MTEAAAISTVSVAPAPDLQTPSAQTNRDEQIRLRAYEVFLERQGGPGDAENDWYRAEAEIKQTARR